MKSLRVQLNLGLGIILLGGFGIQWAARGMAMPYVAEQEMLTRLRHDADAIKLALRFDQTHHAHVDMQRQAPIYSQNYSGHYFVVTEGSQTEISPSLDGQTLNFAPVADGEEYVSYVDGPRQQPLLMLVQAFRMDGHRLTLAVGEDLTDIRAEVSRLGWVFVSLDTAVLMLALLTQWFFVQRALRPYLYLRRELSQIAEGEEESVSIRQHEELPQVEEIRRLMNLLSRRISQSRNAIGNLAHALKTPLAILYRLAEHPALQAETALAEDLKTHSNTIRQLIERELTRARLAGTASPGTRINPHAELNTLVKVLRAIYADKPLRFQIDAPDREIPYDRQDMLELLGNLADNASKWASSRVAIRVDCAKGLSIRVEDDGPGCTARELATLGQRGRRLDETKEGHGLGLAIVRDIVQFYGGAVEYGRSPSLGGFAVGIVIPEAI